MKRTTKNNLLLSTLVREELLTLRGNIILVLLESDIRKDVVFSYNKNKNLTKEKVPCRFEKIRSPFLSAADILPSDSYQD